MYFGKGFESAFQSQSHPCICSQSQVWMKSAYEKRKRKTNLSKVSQLLQEANLEIKTKQNKKHTQKTRVKLFFELFAYLLWLYLTAVKQKFNLKGVNKIKRTEINFTVKLQVSILKQVYEKILSSD